MSSVAIAFASCRVTIARIPSGDTAMYSGSRSLEAARPGNTRTPAARSALSCPSNAAKPAVITVGDANPPLTSMMLTDPTGSGSAGAGAGATTGAVISPSFATSTFVPSGVKISWSGTAPTITDPSNAPVAGAKNATVPGRVLSGLAISDAASTPFFTTTCDTSFVVRPSVVGSIGANRTGAAGFDRSIT